ncbi:MAG: polysaccharide lyase 6 family protein, partial [Candidatus Didemnitutus sp.]|nr:polysaccharide lyase 6 family protein [Candidatus Didemnitutus sp.]
MKIRSLLLATLLLASASSALAVTHTVNNAADFNALPSLNAGDVVVLNSGTYGSLNKTLVSTIATDALAQSNPIYVYAATPGGVDVTAPSQITLQGRGIILAGLDFVSGSGMLANGDDTPVWIIKTDANSRHMTISNVRFLNCTAGDNYGHWLYLEGFNHTVEYCSFEGKNEPNRNATVAFKRNTSEAGITTPRNHVLRYCYFGPREASNASGSTGNGYETIRIGDSSSQAHDMNVTIAHNVFYRAIWRNDGAKPNDMEIISNKSKGNKILHNTFLESYGQLTLRHGDACLVEGNYILGGGYYSGSSILLRAANPHQTGIRIIGTDHVVRNNFLINLVGTNLRAALCLMGGESSHTDGNGSGGYNGYEAAHNAQIYNNTFVDCTELNLGYRSAGTVSPTGVQIYNNVWQGSGTSNGIVRSNSFTPAGSGGNYIYHPSGSYGWTGLTGGTYTSSASPQ